MSYLKFEKKQLVNLEYSLKCEFLRANLQGTYGNTTIVWCNTRKYHGLIVAPVPEIDDDRHVLLSGIDPTIVYNKHEFNLAVRKYSGGFYEPKGHKYIEDLIIDVLPRTIYNIGGVKMSLELVTDDESKRSLARYTILEADETVILRLKPFFAFRSVHHLSKANLYANTQPEVTENGIRFRMYDNYPYLYLQTSKQSDFINMPDWFYNIEYQEEEKRGYDYLEDLFSPGYFEIQLKQGESVILSGGTEPLKKNAITKQFDIIENKRLPRKGYDECLYSTANQFFVKQNQDTFIYAGFPWYGVRTRDTFIAAPGLTLGINNPLLLTDIIDSALKSLSNGIFPQFLNSKNLETCQNSDTSLWFFYALQQLYDKISFSTFIEKYWNSMKSIIDCYSKGYNCNIKMHDNCLIYIYDDNNPQTWMNSTINNRPVINRTGYVVEVNALWYNAIRFSLEIAEKLKEKDFFNRWSEKITIIESSFKQVFWLENEKYLSDYCTNQFKNTQIRPNQIIASALPYSPLTEEQKIYVINCVKHKLLTNKGLRTLTPADPDYQPYCQGTHDERELAIHQGTVHPWLLEFYAKSIATLYQKDSLSELVQLYYGFENCMTERVTGSLNEIYDGDPPHHPRGAGSQAWSVAMALQIKIIIDKFKNN